MLGGQYWFYLHPSGEETGHRAVQFLSRSHRQGVAAGLESGLRVPLGNPTRADGCISCRGCNEEVSISLPVKCDSNTPAEARLPWPRAAPPAWAPHPCCPHPLPGRSPAVSSSQKCISRGELQVSLSYQPVAQRLTVVVLKARHLPKMDITGLSGSSYSPRPASGPLAPHCPTCTPHALCPLPGHGF